MSPAPSIFYYVYILKSKKCNWIYVGYTSNLKKRLIEHHTGKNLTTKRYLPLCLVYYEAYLSKLDALEREKKLKEYGNSLHKLKIRIKNSLEGAG